MSRQRATSENDVDARVEYWNAYSCGHYTRRSPNGSAGVAWCEVCRNYVGVITQRIEDRPRVSAQCAERAIKAKGR